jgi:hypothetical protein
MSKENLTKDLERLRTEVNHIDDNLPESKERLFVLIDELQQRIANDTDSDDANLIENIRDHITNFEAQHPRATAILNDIMVTLSNMGI